MTTGFAGAESGRIRIGDVGRGLRAGADRTVRDRRRALRGRVADHRASKASRAPRDLAKRGADDVINFHEREPVAGDHGR